jgi:hypothetical protein
MENSLIILVYNIKLDLSDLITKLNGTHGKLVLPFNNFGLSKDSTNQLQFAA